MIDPSTSKDVFGTSEDSEEFNGFSKEEIRWCRAKTVGVFTRKPKKQVPSLLDPKFSDLLSRLVVLKIGLKLQSVSLQQIAKQKRNSKQKTSESSTTVRRSPCKSNMADLDVETTIKPVSTVDTQPHSHHSSDIGEPTEISRCLSKLEQIMEAIASHVGLLEPDAQHAEETHVSHTNDQVQEGGSQDGFSDEDFAHLNLDLAGNSTSHRGKRILPEEFLDSESSKKQKLSEFSKNFDCDQEPNQFQFYHPPSNSPPKWPISEHIDQYFKKYFSLLVSITRPTMKSKRTLVSPMVHSLKLLKSMLLVSITRPTMKSKRTLVSPMVHSLKLLKSMLLLQILSRCLPIKAYTNRG